MLINNIAIEIEGIDKAGKDTILAYIATLSNFKYTMNSRGILSQLVYADKFNRNYDYQLLYKPFIIFLDVDEKDHEIRCNLANEIKINYSSDRELFLKYIKILENNNITILKYNTTKVTAYNISIDILDKLDKININDFILEKPIIFKKGN